ncbi:MAG TPA: Ig-like domain-containing protein [Verrucomicrobiae bacterium]|nr:Ig-like domain-containing protein [Verrucomicrobiae bacterium]
MKKTTLLPSNPLLWGIALALVLFYSQTARAGLGIPYSQDADTMHLWHLNDATNQLYAVDSATNPVDGAIPIQLENIGEPTPGQQPTNALYGSPGPGYPGLGSCYSGSTKQHVLAGYNGSSYGGDFPDVSQFCNPNTGAFTFEALINLGSGSSPLSSVDAEILSGDNNGGLGNRGWQWRIEGGTMEWDLLAGSTDNDFKAPLPTSGPNAVKLNAWFHVAVTFTGQSPTNGDPANVFTMYWTALDPSRTSADVLAQYTNDVASPYGIRPLSGAPEGTATPALGISGSSRNTSSNPGNNEGMIGSIMELRVSDIARQSNQMAFVAGGSFPPAITQQPPTNTLVGYGQPLVFGPTASGTAPLQYEWFQGGTNLASQTNLDVSIPSATFAAAGPYYLIVTNSYGSATSSVAQVTVGAVASGLFVTGIGTNGQVSSGDVPDPHYTVIQSSDPSYLGPTTLIFEWNYPIEFSPNSGGYAPTNGDSTWIGLQGNQGGVINNSPAGNYTYRTTFLLDQANPSTVTLQGSVVFSGLITNILINGKSTGISLAPVNGLYIASPFTITNGFVPGINTLDFCQQLASAQNTAIYVAQVSAIGQAVAPGLPVILQQPTNETVRDANLTGPGSIAEFSVSATGCPPLTYQWWADGVPLAGETNYTLSIYNPSAGAQGTNYYAVVTNSSGSVTSSSAVLTLVSTNQPPVCQTLNLVAFNNENVNVQISYLLDVLSSDPDHDNISYDSSDTASTNGSANGLNNVNQSGATLVYTPVAGFVGPDQFTYTIQDSLGTMTSGNVNVLDLSSPSPFTTVPVGGTTNLNAGVSNVPPGYSFQWQLYGANLPGTTSAQLTFSNAQSALDGAYQLLVGDQAGNVVSSSLARVAVNGAPRPGFGVNPMDWVFNGYGTGSTLTNNVLTLTDGTLSEGRSAWYGWPQVITNFSASFVYRDTGGGGADGFTFVLQNSPAGTAALGSGGGGLGYAGIANSVALEFNIYAPNTVGIALQSGGAVSPPFTPTTPLNIASGDPIQVNISYSAGVAQLALTDLTTLESTNFTLDATSVLGDTFENILGTNIAYVGFTGGDGGVASTQTISNLLFIPPSLSLSFQQTASNKAVLSWTPPYNGFLLQTSGNLGGSWQNVSVPINTVGGQYQVQVPMSGGSEFYRLMLP